MLKVQSAIQTYKKSEVQGLEGPGIEKRSWAQVTDKLMQALNPGHIAKASNQASGEYLAEMFKLQVQMNKLHMRVELCSKVAESASTSIKKLQQTQ